MHKKTLFILFQIMIVFILSMFISGCNLNEPKAFDIALKEGVYSNKLDNNYEIYIEFNEISIMEYVKNKSGNCMKDLFTKDEKFYTPYSVQIIISNGITNSTVLFDKMIALDYQTTSTYKLSNILASNTINIKNFELKLIDDDLDSSAERLEICIDSDIIKGIYTLCYNEKSSLDKMSDKAIIKISLLLDDNITIINQEYEKESFIRAGSKLTYYLLATDKACEVVMYVNNELYKKASIASFNGKACYKIEYLTGYKDLEISIKQA